MQRDVRFEDLYAFRAWVRALAVRLASDDAEAADLEQQVWTTAIERPPRDARNLRGWLGTVARNAARNLRRATGRRERHEAAAPPPSSQSVRAPDELAEEAEAQRALVRAVLELDEPYRDTVLLRWFEGLPPSEVAARQGVPVATVNTRLARAHARLRERLDREFEGGRAVWVPLLTGGTGATLLPDGPDGSRAADRSKPRRTPDAVPLVGGAASPIATTGGALMAGTLTKTLAAVVVVALGALFVRWATSADGSPADGASGDGGSASDGTGAKPRTRKRAAAPQVPETGDALAGADPDNDLVGIVVDTKGAPVPDAELTVVEYPWTRTGLTLDEAAFLARDGATTRSKADGTFAFRLRRGDAVNVRAKAAGFATAEHVLRSAGERTRIVLDRAVGIDLLCAKTDGTPVPGVRVVGLTWPPNTEPRVIRRGVSGADGKLAWDDLPPRVKLRVHPAGWREGMEIDLPAEGRVARTLPFGRGRTIDGVVVDAATGAAIAGALVDVGMADLSTAVASAADGTFRLDDWTGRASDDIQCTATGYARGVVRPGDANSVTISLTRGVRLVGRVVGPDAKPVAGALVTATAKVKDETAPRASSAQATSGADGRFVLPDVATDLAHRLVVSARGFARLDRAVEPKAPAATPAAADIDLGDVALAAPRTIAGRVVAEGEGVARATVTLRASGPGAAASDAQTLRRTDDRGRFRFEDLAPGRYVVQSSGEGASSAERTIELGAAADVLDLVLGEASGGETRMLLVKVVDGEGRPVEGASITASNSRAAPVFAKTNAAGTARIETVRRKVMVQASPPRTSDAWVELSPGSWGHAGSAATEITLRLAVGAWTEGTLFGADGKPVAGANVSVLTPDGRWARGGTMPDGRFRIAVPKGAPVRVTWNGQRRVTVKRGFDYEDSREWAELSDVVPGTTGIVLQARKVEEGLSIRARVLMPDGSPAAGVTVSARDLSVNYTSNVGPDATTGPDGRAVVGGLVARRHRVSARAVGRLASPRWADATPGDGDEIVLTLRETKEIRGTITDAEGRPFPYWESGGKRMRVTPWARSEDPGQAWSMCHGVEPDGTFTILVPADESGPWSVEFNLPSTGTGAETVQLGCAVKGVLAGATDVRLVMKPRLPEAEEE